MFHRNLYILAIPMFALWYPLIISKLITIGYQLNWIRSDIEIGEHVVIWTDNPDKMLEIRSLDGLELLIVAGFIQWHYMYSIIFGVLAIAAERAIASVLIENYESNTKLFIPFLLTAIYQTFAIFTALSVLFHKFNSIASHIPWILSCVIAAFVYLFVKKVNESFRREIKSSNRKRVFTISQQFQPGTRLVFVVLGTIAVCGSGMAALTFQIIPSYFSHIIENFTFLNPYLILLTAMFSVPQWEKKFKRMLLTWHFLKKRRKFVNVEIVENSKKDLDMETNLYFKQLADSWI
ncbi:hypothetical protein B9Z55_006920 [Caenorhabditis nigoni]|uniref:Serpentine receptor class gamma n=2 Tax=Caenorhabditis nigoni TaxID=1611254 RepID=A0A2G5V780_9PELO|nr:hypothetical protein B9Z55_006920 [Caenorhabditis nigoni]